MTVRKIGIIATTGQPAIAWTFHTLVLQPTISATWTAGPCRPGSAGIIDVPMPVSLPPPHRPLQRNTRH